MTTTILPDPEHRMGLWGTIGRIENDPAADPRKAWEIASRRDRRGDHASPEGVRDFLDSRHGRHFADDVASELWKGETLEGGDRRRDRPLDGLADRPQDQPRDRDPARASLPDRLGHPLRDHGRASRLTRLPSGSAALPRDARLGVVAGSGWSRSSQRRDDPMTKLSDTQSIILSAAAQRADGNVLPLPGSLRGGAATKVVAALLARGLIREHVIDSPRKADAAMNTDLAQPPRAGRPRRCCSSSPPPAPDAIGVEPEAVPYAFNEGTNSAGEPAAGAPTGADEAPVEAPRRSAGAGRGRRRPRARTSRAAREDPRRHQAGAADRDAPPQGGRDHRPDRRGHRLAAAHGARRLRRRAEEEARPDRHLREGRGTASGSTALA